MYTPVIPGLWGWSGETEGCCYQPTKNTVTSGSVVDTPSKQLGKEWLRGRMSLPFSGLHTHTCMCTHTYSCKSSQKTYSHIQKDLIKIKITIFFSHLCLIQFKSVKRISVLACKLLLMNYFLSNTGIHILLISSTGQLCSYNSEWKLVGENFLS